MDATARQALDLIEAAIAAGDHASALRVMDEHSETIVESGLDLPLDRLEPLLASLEMHAPEDPWVLFYRAWVWSTQRRHTLALATLRRAQQRFDTTLAPDSPAWRRARFISLVAEGVTSEREGLLDDARGAFEEALRVVHADEPRALNDDERRWLEHDPAGFFAFSLRALHLYRRTGLTLSAARVCHNIGTRLMDRGEPRPARYYLEQALELKRAGQNRIAIANTLNSLGHVERCIGLFDRALPHLTEAIATAEELGHDWLVAYALNNLAELHRDAGRPDQAIPLYERSIAIKERTENVFGLAYSSASLADLHLFGHDPATARRLAEHAVDLRMPSDDALEMQRLLSCRARARLADGADPDDISRELDAIVSALEGLDAKGELAVARWWHGLARRAAGDLAGGAALISAAIELAGNFGLSHMLRPHLALDPQALQTAAGSGGAPIWQAAERPVRLTARLFGQLEVAINGVRVPTDRWRSKRAVSLLAVLFHRRERNVHRDELMDCLWPGVSVERASKYLNVALTALRRGLEQVEPRAGGVIRRQGASYRIAPEAIESVDVDQARQLTREAERLAAVGSRSPAITTAELALRLGRGPYLDSEGHPDWAANERAGLEEMLLDLRVMKAEWHLDLGDSPTEAIREATIVTSREPWRERAWHVLMRSHLARGDRSAALHAYRECERALREELDVQPSPELATVARRIAG